MLKSRSKDEVSNMVNQDQKHQTQELGTGINLN